MRKPLFSFLASLCLLLQGAAAWAQIQNDEAQIQKLNELHAQADQFLANDKCHEALVVYNEIFLLEADDEVAYTNSGYCYMLLGKFDRAKESFEDALRINPDNEVAQMGLRKIKDPDGDWREPPANE